MRIGIVSIKRSFDWNSFGGGSGLIGGYGCTKRGYFSSDMVCPRIFPKTKGGVWDDRHGRLGKKSCVCGRGAVPHRPRVGYTTVQQFARTIFRFLPR